MFEVTRYEPPHVFVTKRQTGETYKFSVGNRRSRERRRDASTKGTLVEQRSHIWLREREPMRC